MAKVKQNSVKAGAPVAHLVSLNGGGDSYVFLVDKEVWSWINSGKISPKGSLVKALEMASQDDPSLNEDRRGELLAPEKDNDRAMIAMDLAVGKKVFDGAVEAIEYAKKKGIKVSKQEYQGYSY